MPYQRILILLTLGLLGNALAQNIEPVLRTAPKKVGPRSAIGEGGRTVSTDDIEGSRHTPFRGYRPQFYFRTTDATGAVILPEDVNIVEPGELVEIIDEYSTVLDPDTDKTIRYRGFRPIMVEVVREQERE